MLCVTLPVAGQVLMCYKILCSTVKLFSAHHGLHSSILAQNVMSDVFIERGCVHSVPEALR
jgi:hypothetical protein